MKTPTAIEKRFLKYVIKKDGCWDWSGYKNVNGYGRIYDHSVKRQSHAHRVSYRIHVGPIPPGLFVCHSCDNPSCSNPEHLFLGTQFDNMSDCVVKKRHNKPSGERHFFAKLNKEAVVRIRTLYDAGENYHHLAKEYGVSSGTLSAAATRRTWKSLD